MVTMEKLQAGVVKSGLQLNPRQLEQFTTYYYQMVAWNRQMNLTTVTDRDEVQIKHFLDSLTVSLVCQCQLNRSQTRLIDIGTGAGLPGIPLKILFPHIKLVLVDATNKKGLFLNDLKQKLGLADIEIVVGRAEEIAHLTEYREGFDIVVSRAVAPLPALVELTLPFCTIGGVFIAQKKGEVGREISQAIKAINTLGGSLRSIKKVELEEFLDHRQLIIIDKVRATPSQYPRRSGMPAKKPLL